jgi:glycosyltransferase involved in cell wall biosynthesis
LSLGWRIPGEVHVVGLGTTFRQREPQPAPDGRISMLYVSTIEPRKGHLVLVEAFDALRAKGLDVDLTLVGREGWACAHIVRTLRSHPDLGGRLRWYESANDLTVATLAADCSIGVFPSDDEGFGLFLEEGLAYGLKMVVNDIPVFRERTQANVIFADQTPEGLAAAIMRAHESEWVPLPAGGLRTMQDFGWDLADLVRDVVT